VAFDPQPRLTGELIELRPLRPGDWDELFAVASDSLIWEQHPERDRYREHVFKIFSEKRWNVAGRLPLSPGSFNKSLDLHGSTIMIGKNPKSKLHGHFWRESTGAGATTGK